MTDKEKNKEPLTAVHWSVEGGVKFLGANNLTTTNDSDMPVDPGSIEDLTKKDEGKASVTVASFGFPQVSIQPPETTKDLDASSKGGEKEDKVGGATEEQSTSTFVSNIVSRNLWNYLIVPIYII